MRRLGLIYAPGHKPKVTWRDKRVLYNIDSVRSSLVPFSWDIFLTDTTLAVKGTVVMVETGTTVFEEQGS